MNALNIFNDINLLGMPKTSKKSQKSKFVGSNVIYYQSPEDLGNRMKVMIGSLNAGNKFPILKNDISMINDKLLRIGAVTSNQHEKLFEKYLKWK